MSWLAYALFVASSMDTPGRPYHKVALERLATTRWTHVEVCGPVVYRRRMADRDWHITLDNGRVKVVVEIIEKIPLVPPSKGDTVRVRGISRLDPGHGNWPEVHPAEAIWKVETCK